MCEGGLRVVLWVLFSLVGGLRKLSDSLRYLLNSLIGVSRDRSRSAVARRLSQRGVDRVIEGSNTGDALILSPPTSPPGEAAEGELRGGFFLALSHLVLEAAEGGLREGDTADGSTMTQAVVHLHDVSFCSRCGEDCSALYPEGGSVGPLFHAVPCMQCGWDTGLEYSDAEAYSYGYGGICVACGATQSPHIACLSCGGPVWPDHTDWDYVCGEFRSREEIVQIGVALASRGLSVDLCVRVLVDGGLGGLMEDMVRVGLVARLTRLALGDDVRPLHAAAADIAGSAGPDAVI